MLQFWQYRELEVEQHQSSYEITVRRCHDKVRLLNQNESDVITLFYSKQVFSSLTIFIGLDVLF